MIIRRSRVALFAATILSLPVAFSPVFVTPAAAQWVVYDPTNYVQNVLSAARALEQINNQIQSLQNEAQMLINQARNLASLPYSSLQQLQQSVQRTQALLGQAQRIAFDVQQIDQAFAYIIGNWNNLARIVFESFAGLGLQASGTGFSLQDLMRPGRVAQTGLDAARPLLESISNLMGWIAFFENFIQIACLLFAWALVLLAFFILAIQLFITLIEFKLTTLAGFVLIPFGLFGKTAFMAERVLGNVISSGIKVLVLAVIIGIGSTLFSQFTAGFGGQPPTIDDAMAVVLAALSLLGLGIFGPGIANGIVSGGPQLGAGSAIGTGLVAGGAAMAAGGAAGLALRGGASAISGGAAAVRGGASAAGAASAAYSLGSLGQSGAAGVASGLGGVARAAGGAAASPLRRAAQSVRSSFADGVKSGFGATGGSSSMGTVANDAGSAAPAAAGSAASPPAWAQRMRRGQTMSHGVTLAAHAIRSGDSHGGGSSINLSGGDRT